MGLSNDQREKRRTEVLEVASRLFIEQGYEGTSLQDIATGAHCSKDTLYAWFGGKAEVLTAIFRQRAQTMSGRLDAEVAGREPAYVLYVIVLGLLHMLSDTPVLALFLAAVAGARNHPELRSIITESVNRKQLAVYFEMCRAQGLMAFDDAEKAARMFIAMAEADYPARLSARLIDRIPPEEIQAHAKLAAQMFMKAVAPERKP